MDLKLNTSLINGYSSRSQHARLFSEDWVEREMYCPACPSSALDRLRHGTKVIDFQCPECNETYQLKSAARKIGNRVQDSAYKSMMEAVLSNASPNLMLMQYSRASWEVQNLILIPRQLIVPSIIEKRTELRQTAQRAGWVGCNILLSNVPMTGRIHVIDDRSTRNPSDVRKDWKVLQFVNGLSAESRGWIVDVLRCVQLMGEDEFTLREMYARFGMELSLLHPQNRHVQPKIRQQLQVLRDRGIVIFIGKGVYQLRR